MENGRLLTNLTALFGQTVLWRWRRWYFVEYDGCLKIVKTLCIKTRFFFDIFKIVTPKIVYTQVRRSRRVYTIRVIILIYVFNRFSSFYTIHCLPRLKLWKNYVFFCEKQSKIIYTISYLLLNANANIILNALMYA